MSTIKCYIAGDIECIKGMEKDQVLEENRMKRKKKAIK
jgi:hypothetical protein